MAYPDTPSTQSGGRLAYISSIRYFSDPQLSSSGQKDGGAKPHYTSHVLECVQQGEFMCTMPSELSFTPFSSLNDIPLCAKIIPLTRHPKFWPKSSTRNNFTKIASRRIFHDTLWQRKRRKITSRRIFLENAAVWVAHEDLRPWKPRMGLDRNLRFLPPLGLSLHPFNHSCTLRSARSPGGGTLSSWPPCEIAL